MPDQKALAPQSLTQAKPGPDGPEAPLTFEQVLAQEDAVLGGKQRSALCISGGGIRSATFALGALQGLAELGILENFDYLSTVSGGGYIGSWLTAWKERWKGLTTPKKLGDKTTTIVCPVKALCAAAARRAPGPRPAPARVQQLSFAQAGPLLRRYLDPGCYGSAEHVLELAGLYPPADVRSHGAPHCAVTGKGGR